LEKKGIPTAIICSDGIPVVSQISFDGQGISAPRLVTIPHPLAGITPEEVQKKAENAVDAIVAVLVGAR